MIRKAPRSIGAVVGAVLTLAFAVTAQRPLTHDDYDQWQSLRGNAYSSDGKWVAFQIEPQWGDGVMEVRQTEGTVVHRHPLASGARFSSDNRYVVFSIGRSKVEARNKQLDELRKRAAEPEKGEEEGGAARGAGPGAGFGQGAGAAGGRGGRGGAGGPPAGAGAGGGRGGRGGAGGPGGGDESASVRGDMGVMDLATGKVEVIKHVKGFTLPDEAALLIYHLDSAEAIAEAEKAEAEKKEGEKKEEGKEPAAKPEEPKVEEPKAAEPATQEGQRGGRQGRGGRGTQAGTQGTGGRGRTPTDPMERKRKEGTTMVVRNLANGSERRVDHVVSYGLTRKAKWFHYHTSVKKPDPQKSYGLFAEKLDGTGKVTLLSGVADVTGITHDREETSIAFMSNLADFAAEKPKSDIYVWDGSEKAARAVVTPKTQGVPSGYSLGSPSFSRDGSVIEFTVQPPAEADPVAYLPDEKVSLDLWHWNDPQIQTAQAKGAGRRSTTRSVVWHRNAEKLLVVGDDQIERVRMITPDGSRALATDGAAYEKLTTWDGRYTDVYLVNTFNGTRTKVLEKLRGSANSSPTGRYLLWFVDGHWNSYDVATGERKNLTAGLPVSFSREDDDRPEADSNHGVCGWTKDDHAVVFYDEFDLWQITPKTGEAVCVTDGFGRATKTTLRHLSIEREQEGLPAELMLTAVNQDTLMRGVYKDWLDSVKKPFRVFQIEKGLDGITKAKKADRFFFTVQTFSEPPDLWTSDAEFKQLKKLSSLNPQQKDYRWGKAELVHWIDGDGKPARGILVKPDGFDPKQKYPMLVYFYEKMSNNLNRYVSPAPGTSPNASYYVSNGYLFFMPDITYEVGYPGNSCVKCVVSGVQHLIAQGFVDSKGIGAAGHSWGGYQTAFLVTRTNIFKAVESGAPVSNMISAYGGIRYGSGVSRQFQYERTQSRIGGTPWEYPLRFWENSPIYFADKVNTPVLILHNDQDGAVPWTNGIEYFMALRRLGKEAYLFNYTGEDHGLARRQNQKDWSRRMSEYFGHHLRGETAPKWMKDGVPYADRDKEKLAFAPSYQDITKYVDKVKSEAAKAAPATAPVGEPAAAEASAEPAQRGGGDPSAAPAKTGGQKPGGGGEDNGNGDSTRAPVEASAALQTGAVAPDFAVADHTGKVRTLKEFAGKKVLIWFYPRANTPGCTAEGCAFRDRFKEFEQAGVVVLGASVDSLGENLAFQQKHDFPFPLLCDVDRKLGMAYGACSDAKAPAARRNAVLIDGKGKILRTWERVDARTFPGELLNELRALAK